MANEYSVRPVGQFDGQDSGYFDVMRGKIHGPVTVHWNILDPDPDYPYIWSQAQAQLVAQIIAEALNSRAAEIAALDPQEARND